MKDASELTIRVLDGGKSPARKKRPPRKSGGHAVNASSPSKALVAPIGLQADVTPKLLHAAPAFGDVLRSLAHAAAVTQTALDDAALESLQTLAGQQVDVPVLVEQELNDDGIPTDVTIRTESVPLTSIIAPSMQMVNDLTVRMDMRVQSFDSTSGIKFNQNMSSAGVSYKRHGLAFGVNINNTNVDGQFSNLSDFSSGSVLVSMEIADRTGFEIPTPLEYGVGSNLMIRLLGITQTVTTNTATPPVTTVTRKATLSVKQVLTNGSVATLNAGDYDVTLPPGLLPTPGTSIEVVRNPETPNEPYEERTIRITKGQLTKETKFYL